MVHFSEIRIEFKAAAGARVRPNAMHVITGSLAAADRDGERGKIFNPMTAAHGARTFDRRTVCRWQRISPFIMVDQ